MRLARSFVAVALVASVAACSAAPSSEDVSSATAALHGWHSAVYVTAAVDANGGWDVAEVNGGGEVASGVALDFSASGLDGATVTTLEALPTSELVLEGSFTPVSFVVSTAYRGMPGMTYAATDAFYEAPGASAHLLDVGGNTAITSVDVSGASAAWVQQSWLAGQVTDGALVAGSITSGVLAADQVFLPLPYAAATCAVQSPTCGGPTVATYTRDANLCLEFASCEDRGKCPFFIPFCSEGYTRVSWAGTHGACPNYACDPSFLTTGN